MVIREYTDHDELAWLRCRVLSFLDCSYYNDVLTRREAYENDSVSLVAEEDDKIIGLIDAEIEKEAGSLCVAGSQRGAVIWHLAVLPEYRRRHVAASLWSEAKARLKKRGIPYCEVWTQEDEAANRWYQAQGFVNIREKNWLRCYARPSKADWFLNRENVGELYGVEEMIFEIKTSRREEIADYCYRIDEVRLYATEL
ncbi:MAG: GNAT family N-acetyltransferase [Ruminococcaceae bacterium]|nr:GNAT family N-acetyltransferase [Oscillospiraceae bacterium]